MSEEERRNYNIRGFLKVFRLTLFLSGSGMLLAWYVLSRAGYANLANIMVIFLPLIIVVLIVIAGQQFYKGKNIKRNKTHIRLTYGILGAVSIFVILLLYYGMKDNKLEVSGNSITISGMYGERIPYASVTKVEITDHLPELAARTNGFAFNKHLKGNFRTKKGEVIKLFVNAGRHKYLKISCSTTDYYWNSDTEDMDKIYAEIKSQMK